MAATLDEIQAFLDDPMQPAPLKIIVRWQYGAALGTSEVERKLWRVLTLADERNLLRLKVGAAELRVADVLAGDDYAFALWELVKQVLEDEEKGPEARTIGGRLMFGLREEVEAFELWAHGDAGARIRAAGLNI